MNIHDDFATIKRYFESCTTVKQVNSIVGIRKRFTLNWGWRKADFKTRVLLWNDLYVYEQVAIMRVQQIGRANR